jgi:superfamily II DNA or RNA helicase
MQFILSIVDHRKLGFVLAPYYIRPDYKAEVYEVYDKITLQKLPAYEHILSPEQIQLVRYIENYNDQNLFKLFCKKKLTPHDFMNKMDDELLEQHIRPYIEKQIAKCLDVLQYNPEPIFHKTLQNKIYESDRVILVDKDCSTVFNFTRNSEGIRYKLTIENSGKIINLNGKEGITIVTEPACIAVEENLYVFRDIDSKKVQPFFERDFIQIPKQTESKYFETFVKNSIAKYKVNAEGFNIIDEKAEPRAVVSLEKNLAGQLSLILKFVYGANNIFHANRKSGMKVSCSIKDDHVEFIRTKRDYDFENSCISRLLSYGLVNKEGPYFEPMTKNDKQHGAYGPITWLNYNKELLKKGGFEIAQSNLEKDFYLGHVELKIEVSEKSNDWFDIMASVEFDGFKIPFVDFKENIVSGIREFVLPNNKVMILPEEWFVSYHDLINFSETEGKILKLKKQHFSILNNRETRLTGDFRENLKKLLNSEYESLESLPEDIHAELRNYQHQGYSWMYRLYNNGFGGCLADDMGLGKTLQTLALLKQVSSESEVQIQTENVQVSQQLNLFEQPLQQSQKSDSKTSLIVVPTSLVHNWMNECNKFLPSLRIQSYIGSSRGQLSDCVAENDLVVTSYGILRNDLQQFLALSFLYVVLDESQMIKNPGSKTYQAVVQLKADNRLVLSGTPIENSLSDLWAQFNFINPGLLGNLGFFQNEFQYPIEKLHDENKSDRLQQLIAPFILRRTKGQVARELPDLSEQVIECDLNEVQEVFYEREKSKARNLVLENINRMGLRKASMQILQSLMKLRQIANHPVLVDEDYIAGSGKFDEVKRVLETLNREGHKALIFSSFVGHLNLISAWLELEGIEYTLLTGQTRDREKIVKQFQEDENKRFFLISLKAGGVGLNLTAASYVLMLDPWWNPAAEKQAINRAHRIGQDKHVMVYRFISRNTLEEKILKLQERKSKLADIFVNENLFASISQDEILELFD